MKMLILKYLNDMESYQVSYSSISPNIEQITGDFPVKTDGYTLSREGKQDNWDHSGFTGVFREIEGGIQFSSDGSVYVAPPDPEPVIPPEPYVPTLEEVKKAKIEEMSMMQENVMRAGIEVALADGTVEHFDLNEKERSQLAVLQAKVAGGAENIPWHTSDEEEHCKYYSSEDMGRIMTAAFELVTYHETYFRDLRIYIRSLSTREEAEAVTYGMEIPEEYRSQPLKDMLADAS